MTDLESIRKRLEDAPKGPWTGDRNDGTVKYDVLANDVDEDGDHMVVIHGCNGNEDPSYGIRDDAAERLILNAPTDIAFLLAEVDRLTTALASAKAEERAAVVATMRNDADMYERRLAGSCSADALRKCADAVESNRHRGKP